MIKNLEAAQYFKIAHYIESVQPSLIYKTANDDFLIAFAYFN